MFLRKIPYQSFVRRYGKKSNVLQTLKERGLIAQVSQPEQLLCNRLDNGDKVKLYCGADPTAKSLHLGNLLPLMVLLHFYISGHDIVALVGGATGRVGDPSGRKTERTTMKDQDRIDNVTRISKQLTNFFKTGLEYYKSKTGVTSVGNMVSENNYNWWKDVKMLDFLAEYGKHVRIQSMLSRDSISSRLTSNDGLGFNEFTYQILQAYDFYHLHKHQGVNIQVGGNDQWGNITAGIDFISRIEPKGEGFPAFGITVPLLTTSTGEKFGKSAGNAVFIDPEINTPFDVYQFFVNTTDADVKKFLNIFTLLSSQEIHNVIAEHVNKPQERIAQRMLAREVVDLLHGCGKGNDAEAVSDITFGRMDEETSASELIRLFSEARILNNVPKSLPLSEVITHLTGSSKSEVRRRLKQGSVYLGASKTKIVEDISAEDLRSYLIDNKVLILRLGKQKCFVAQID